MSRIEKTHIGFIGVGNMGMGMLTRWRSLGGAATVYDIEPARMQAAQVLGGHTVSSPSAVAGALGSDALLVICVVDAAQCDDVLWGVNGVCESAPAGLTVLLTPTLGPADVQAIATRLASAGIALIDAPMSGGPVRAAAGTMSLMVSGPTRRQWWFVLEALADPVFDLGDVIGDGAKTKLVNNLLAAINLVGAAQIMTLAARLELDPKKTLAVIGHFWGRRGASRGVVNCRCRMAAPHGISWAHRAPARERGGDIVQLRPRLRACPDLLVRRSGLCCQSR